jgi:hypothetical protein
MSSKPYITQEMKENIADDLALGYSFADIADRYGVSYSTIRRAKNNSPEAVPTLIEPASEEKVDTIDTSIIPDTEENVKPEPDCDGQQRTEMDCGGQCRTETDYEKQKIYIVNILKAELGDIDEEIRSFEKRIEMLQASLEERRQKQAYLRDFIKSMR